MSSTVESSVLACIASAIPAAEGPAHFARARELFGKKAQERLPLADGYAFRFPSESFEAVAQFVTNERRCCPFMRFELTLERDSGPVWLRMTGPQGTRDVLDVELKLARPFSCD